MNIREQISVCMTELEIAAVDTSNCLNNLLQEIETNESVPFEVRNMAVKLNESRENQLSIVKRLQVLQTQM